MLRNRTFLAFLRQTAYTSASPLRSQLKVILTKPQLLSNTSRQYRAVPKKTSLGISQPSLLSRWPSLVRRQRNVRLNSNKTAPPSAQELGSQAPQTVSGRFRELSRKYGWAAVGVYLGLSVLDFPFCFLAVRLIGPERIGEVEHAIVDGFWSLVSFVVPSMGPEDRAAKEDIINAELRETQSLNVAAHRHNENASIWTQLLLAYGVHKSLIFFRVPLTAAVTPKVVKTLRSWGWKIGRPGKQVKSPS